MSVNTCKYTIITLSVCVGEVGLFLLVFEVRSFGGYQQVFFHFAETPIRRQHKKTQQDNEE